MKILVVDDEKLLVKGIKFNLENEGYQVETAFDGAAAVELAKSESFDLIILDLMMPEVDGLTACMRIRGILCGAHHHAHRPQRGRGQDHRPRVRRGRLRHQALQHFRAQGAYPRLLRRAGRTAQKRTELLTAGGIALDTERRIALRDGVPVDLTAKEYDILSCSSRTPPRILARKT